jgi:citrate lyase subunit beta / citryl-CoA lyase
MVKWDDQLLRSLLFVPGSDTRKLGKVESFGSDAVVIDLEDAVADEEKTAARATTRDAIPTFAEGTVVIVRVNGITTGRLEDDIAAVVCERLDAIMVPKVEDAETLAVADRAIGAAEEAAGIPRGTIRVVPLLETSVGVSRCDAILEGVPERVHTIAFGAGDFTTELGIDLTVDATEVAYARSRLVIAARAAGLAAPIDGPWLRLQDLDGLAVDSRRSRGLGFQGRVVVYPPLLQTVLAAYSALDDAEAARQRKIVEDFEEAESRGVASLRVDGIFVDYPIYRMAKDRILRYDAWRETQGDQA